jgi:hypothetical protein
VHCGWMAYLESRGYRRDAGMKCCAPNLQFFKTPLSWHKCAAHWKATYLSSDIYGNVLMFAAAVMVLDVEVVGGRRGYINTSLYYSFFVFNLICFCLLLKDGRDFNMIRAALYAKMTGLQRDVCVWMSLFQMVTSTMA